MVTCPRTTGSCDGAESLSLRFASRRGHFAGRLVYAARVSSLYLSMIFSENRMMLWRRVIIAGRMKNPPADCDRQRAFKTLATMHL
jgi:hypothetical protein